MTFTHGELPDALDSVNSIPLIPFDAGRIDYEGHARNIDYLMQNNHLSDGRPRVIGLAGTSLVHHIRPEEHLRLVDHTGQRMGGEGLLLAALVPNPLAQAGDFVDAAMALSRPPDVFLIMPLTGTFSPEGLYGQLLDFTTCYGERHGARFLYYYRSPRDRDAILRLLNDSPHMVGVKIGTDEEDVPAFVAGVGAGRIVIWGVGDRSTAAAELGARGHTSGINIVFCARLGRHQQRAAQWRLRGGARGGGAARTAGTAAFCKRPRLELRGGGRGDSPGRLRRRGGRQRRAFQPAGAGGDCRANPANCGGLARLALDFHAMSPGTLQCRLRY